MTSRTLSVAMASYNGSRYLGEQLASLAGQSRLPDELVICDDASTDTTVAMLEVFAATAPFPVRIHHHDRNLGHNRTFERVLSLCRGDVVLPCDQDDAWSPDKLAVVESAFDARPATAVVLVDQEVCDADLVPSGRTKLGNVRSGGLGDSYYIPGCASALDRRWLDVALPLPAGHAYDTWIIKPAHHLGVVHIVERPLQRYRRHGSNASSDVTSQAGGVSRLGLSRGSRRGEVLDGWRDEVRDIAAVSARLRERAAVLAAAAWADGLAPALDGLNRRAAALEDRRRVLARGRATRAPAVLGLFARGGYDEFLGWRSAARDLTR